MTLEAAAKLPEDCCSGNLETTQSDTGLCVAKMATITGPIANSDYQIDVTEVTKGQYDAWLATNPALPPSTDANCGYVTSYAERSAQDVYAGPDADHHPVVYVDWCDAYEYCAGVGKRLCGAIGGGSVEYAVGFNDATVSQWYRACTSGGTYPYGSIYEPSTCDGIDYWKDNSLAAQTVLVGSLANCVTSATGYAGVYDLSGNVLEWEDGCSDTGLLLAACPVRGGAFFYVSSYLACGKVLDSTRDYVDYDIGFRCCSQ